MIDVKGAVDRLSDDQLESELKGLITAAAPTLISRVPTKHESTHVIEEVSISTEDDLLELVCKYSGPLTDPVSEHRRGVIYEGEIYKKVFPDPVLRTPACFGTFALDDVHCLVLEHIEGDTLDAQGDRDAFVELAGDLGAFHAGGVPSLPPNHNVFNRSYFSRLMTEIDRFPGVTTRLERSASTVVDVLANAPRALIHGGLARVDVMVNGDGPVVIDWEAAGVGPGVLDFATLTLNAGNADLAEECEDAYWTERGDVSPAWGARNLAAARVLAAGLMLLDMSGEQYDPHTEALALDTIAAQTSRLRG